VIRVIGTDENTILPLVAVIQRLWILALFALACSGSDLVLPKGSNGEGTNLVKMAGDGQSAPVQSELPAALIVRLADDLDNPVANHPITWLVTGGGGTVAPVANATGSDGQSSARWTLGAGVGTQTVTAVVSGVGVAEFTATATAVGGGGGGGDGGDGDGHGKGGGKPSHLAVWGGNGQQVTAGATVPEAPSVLVTDASGNGVAGVQVTFSVVAGGGGITGATPVTASNGVAKIGSWTLGTAGGINKLQATAQGSGIANNPIVFEATATVVPAPRRLVFRVQPSRADEDKIIEPAVQVAVVDGDGQVVPSAQGEVRLSLLGGSSRARLRGDVTRSLKDGVATFGDLRVTRSGSDYRLRASMSGFTSIESNTFAIDHD
jgi:hypothetical protein